MNLTLNRLFYTPDCTRGVLSCGDDIISLTLEDPFKSNKPNISCIPKGMYKCVRYSSTKYPDTWQVMDVPFRDYILFHVGNDSSDTRGCILPGTQFGKLHGKDAVLHSRDAFKHLMSYTNGMGFFYLKIIGDF